MSDVTAVQLTEKINLARRRVLEGEQLLHRGTGGIGQAPAAKPYGRERDLHQVQVQGQGG